jgi:hypothetical protein
MGRRMLVGMRGPGRLGQGFEAALGGAVQERPGLVAGQLELELQRQQGAGHAQVAVPGGGSEVGLGQRSRADAAGHTWGGTLASKAKPTLGMLLVLGVRLRTRKYKTS